MNTPLETPWDKSASAQPSAAIEEQNPKGTDFWPSRNELAMKAFIILHAGQNLQDWFEAQLQRMKCAGIKYGR